MSNPGKFVSEVKKEASRITWPTRKETIASSIMVVVMVIIAALFFLLVDYFVSIGIKALLGI